MRKLFTFLCAALMSVGMWADPNIVTPTISGDKEFTESTTVTMTCPSPNADIYYTTDGVTDPKCDCAAAPEYKQPITITETTIIKAAAYDGNDWSAVAEVTFTKKAPAPSTYTLQLVADPEKGSVALQNPSSDIIDNGNGKYTVPENTEVKILATPLEGYKFNGWKEGNSLCDFTECGTALNTIDNPLTITMTADTAFMAAFVADAPKTTHKLQLVVNDTTMGAVAIENPSSDIVKNEDGSYSVPEDMEVSIKATAKEGYRFAGWREGNVDELNCYYCGKAINTQDNPYKVKLTADKAIMAVFEKKPELTMITVKLPSKDVPADDKVEIAGTFEGGKASLEKLDNGWFINTNLQASENQVFKIRDAANDKKVLCKLIPANEGEGKWVQAIFKFGNYWKDDTWKGTPCKAIMDLDLSNEAQYGWKENAPEPVSFTLQLAINDSAMGTVAVTNLLGSGIVDLGEGKYTVPEDVEVAIKAEALKGYKFAGWKEGDMAVNTKDNPWKTYISKDVTITATFEADDQAIDEVQSDKVQSTKVLRNGMLLIEKNGKFYNAMGAQVK